MITGQHVILLGKTSVFTVNTFSSIAVVLVNLFSKTSQPPNCFSLVSWLKPQTQGLHTSLLGQV